MSVKISIVIPNYNSGSTLKETLNSLIEQAYENLEIIVIDGGSIDISVDVIKEYEQHLAWWVSELDLGQSDAINKGFKHCTGDVVNWLCSDDLLAPNALNIINQNFLEYPETDVLVGAGSVQFLGVANSPASNIQLDWLRTLKDKLGLKTRGMLTGSADTKRTTYVKNFNIDGLALMPAQCFISQPSCFYRRSLLDRIHPIDESYHYAMDTELWNYFKAKNVKWRCIDDVLSISIQDGQNKTSTGGYKVALELERIYRTYSNDLIPLTFWQKHFRYPLEKFIMRNSNQVFLIFLAGLLWGLISLLLVPFYGLDKVKAMRWTRWA